MIRLKLIKIEKKNIISLKNMGVQFRNEINSQNIK